MRRSRLAAFASSPPSPRCHPPTPCRSRHDRRTSRSDGCLDGICPRTVSAGLRRFPSSIQTFPPLLITARGHHAPTCFLEHRMRLIKLALAIAALAPLACYATLGAAPAARTHTVAAARSSLQAAATPVPAAGAAAAAAAAQYTVREANDVDGVTIREYVLPTNVVF